MLIVHSSNSRISNHARFKIRRRNHYGGGHFDTIKPESMLKNHSSTGSIFCYFKPCGTPPIIDHLSTSSH